jgi:hypothetical protein
MDRVSTDTGTQRHFVGTTRGDVEYSNYTADLGNKNVYEMNSLKGGYVTRDFVVYTGLLASGEINKALWLV